MGKTGDGSMDRSILSVRKLTKRFGGLAAVDDCSYEVRERTITGLIGPNGAGKTTMFNLICGNLQPNSGEVYFYDERITGLKPYQIARKGVGRTFQITRIFKGMSVWDNLLLVPRTAEHRGIDATARAREILETIGLSRQAQRRAGTLAYGQQKLLEFARAHMCCPRLVLMDEVFAGLNPDEIDRQIALIRKLRDTTSVTFLVVDHAVSVVLKLCEDIIVMDQGKILARGDPRQIENNEKVVEAYLGAFSSESQLETE